MRFRISYITKPFFFISLLAVTACQKDEDYNNRIPEVSTADVKNIVELTAEGSGSILTGFDTFISAYGLCYSTNHNPTVTDSIAEGNQISITKNGNKREEIFQCQLTGLLPNTTYYAKAFAVNSTGTGYGNEVSFSTSPLVLGQRYGGGVIFYINNSGEHGLIAASNDQSINSQWFNGISYIRTGATGIAVGEGNANTLLIINKQGEGIYAAAYCYNLQLNGYNDWFLPSKDELNLMYQQKELIGGFSNDFYWSSTEYGEGSAWEQVFNSGTQYYVNKNSQIHVRAIRVF